VQVGDTGEGLHGIGVGQTAGNRVEGWQEFLLFGHEGVGELLERVRLLLDFRDRGVAVYR